MRQDQTIKNCSTSSKVANTSKHHLAHAISQVTNNATMVRVAIRHGSHVIFKDPEGGIAKNSLTKIEDFFESNSGILRARTTSHIVAIEKNFTQSLM